MKAPVRTGARVALAAAFVVTILAVKHPSLPASDSASASASLTQVCAGCWE